MALFSVDDVGALLQTSSPTAYRIAKAAGVETVGRGSKKNRGVTKQGVHEIIDSTEMPAEEKAHLKKLVSLGHPAIRRAVAARRWLTATEVACLLGASRNSVIRWTNDGRIPVARGTRSSVIYDTQDIVSFCLHAGMGIEWDA